MKMPEPMSGYAYAYKGRYWRTSSDELWEIECGSPAVATFVGVRRIDGTLCNVWRSIGGYIAQTRHGEG